jgi:anoctamin-10
MALLNNFLELRSDAYKMTVHHRRPIPQRTDTIGPWLDALTFLTWLGALTNAALVYLFHPKNGYVAVNIYTSDEKAGMGAGAGAGVCERPGALNVGVCEAGDSLGGKTGELLMTALLVALAASHGAILMRGLVRYAVRRAVLTGSEEVKGWEREEREVRERFSKGAGERVENVQEVGARDGREEVKGENEEGTDNAPSIGFWDNDEGLEEIWRISKEV